MDKDNLALVALEKLYKGRLFRLGGINGPSGRVISLSRNPDGNGLIDACIVGSDGDECVVQIARLFDDDSLHESLVSPTAPRGDEPNQ